MEGSEEEFVLPLSLFRVSGRAVCVGWRVVGLPGPNATGELRPGLEHLPVGFPLMGHRGNVLILANLLLPSQFR